MKRVLLLLAVLLFSAGTMMAQQDKAAEKAAKKAEKEAKKAAEAAEQMALFEQGVQALKEKDFVLEAERVEFKRGQFVYVTGRLSNWRLTVLSPVRTGSEVSRLTAVLRI